MLISILMISIVAGAMFVNLASANPLPRFYTRISIASPQNTTYSVNTITLNFSAESRSALSWLNFCYSLDGQELRPIESIETISEDLIPINPGIYERDLKGSHVLFNLSEGWHNITVSQIRYSSTDDTLNGDDTQMAFMQFLIALPSVQEPFPTTLVAVASGASAAFIVAGLLVYFKKRRHNKILMFKQCLYYQRCCL